MRRRGFIALVGGTTGNMSVRGARAAAPEVPRVGFVYPGPRAAAGPRIEAFVSGLRATGFTLPQIELLVRAGKGDPTRIDALIRDVIASDGAAIGAFGPSVLPPTLPGSIIGALFIRSPRRRRTASAPSIVSERRSGTGSCAR